MSRQPALEVRSLTCRLRQGGLEEITFEVSRGERVAVFGPAACGKSVLLSILYGRRVADAGEALVEGVSPHEAANRMGCALQSDPDRRGATPRQQILNALSEAQVPSSQRTARLTEALEVAGLYERADMPVRELNHSAAVSLQIAAAVAHRPEIILLDDLFPGLSGPQAARWWGHMEERRHLDDVTVVHATTNTLEAQAADRVLLLQNGRAIAFSEPEALLRDHSREEICIEAADVAAVERTLRGIADVEVVTAPEGTRFYAMDAGGVAAHLFRHPVAGMKSVFVRRPTLWDCLTSVDAGTRTPVV